MKNKSAQSILFTHETTTYHTVSIDNIDIFYRTAGSQKNKVLLLLHGYPSSSHMFRDIIPHLAKDYYIIAPDYPGFGYSSMPDHTKFKYSFDKYAELVEKLLQRLSIAKYAMYVFDYGAPVGFRLFHKNPKNITAIISQNGNAYDEGLGDFWNSIRAYWKTNAHAEREALRWLTSIKATRWQYENGVPSTLLTHISPDGWFHDQTLLDRPGNADIQLDLFYDYRTNIPLYPEWQKAFREHQPPLLAVWGKNDEIFIAPGATAFKRDLPEAEIHLLEAGHFPLETSGNEITTLILDFLQRKATS